MTVRIGSMLSDLGRSLFTRPITERYPFEHKTAPARFRGKLHYQAANCKGCRLCVRDCPSKAIEIITLDQENKRYALKYDVGRCVFCGQCVQTCRFDALAMSNEGWELAACDRHDFSS